METYGLRGLRAVEAARTALTATLSLSPPHAALLARFMRGLRRQDTASRRHTPPPRHHPRPYTTHHRRRTAATATQPKQTSTTHPKKSHRKKEVIASVGTELQSDVRQRTRCYNIHALQIGDYFQVAPSTLNNKFKIHFSKKCVVYQVYMSGVDDSRSGVSPGSSHNTGAAADGPKLCVVALPFSAITGMRVTERGVDTGHATQLSYRVRQKCELWLVDPSTLPSGGKGRRRLRLEWLWAPTGRGRHPHRRARMATAGHVPAGSVHTVTFSSTSRKSTALKGCTATYVYNQLIHLLPTPF